MRRSCSRRFWQRNRAMVDKAKTSHRAGVGDPRDRRIDRAPPIKAPHMVNCTSTEAPRPFGLAAERWLLAYWNA